jgi:hypothetical protein
MDDKDWDQIEIPLGILKRKDNPPVTAPDGPRKDLPVSKSDVEVEDETPDAEVPAPKPAKKPAKAPGKPAGKAKAAKADKPAKADKAPAKPRKAPAPKDDFGYREGSMKSQAAALYAHKKGATLEEVKEKLGSVQLNVLKELEGKGHTVKRVKEKGDGTRQVTRYFLSV